MRFELAKSLAMQTKYHPVYWDSNDVINGHFLIVGKSGSGKTTLLKQVIDSLQHASDTPLRIHVIDPHGDIDVPRSSECLFSESTPYGFNPLEIHADPHFGGVRKKIQSFIAAINRTSRVLGSKQESVLRYLLQDLYAANGFYADKPDSWRINDGVERRFPKKHPTLADALRFSESKLRAIYTGSNSNAVQALETVNKKASAIYAKSRRGGQLDLAALEAELKPLKDAASEAYTDYIYNIHTGRELDDLLRYDSKDVLKSVVERIENLNSVGIFKNVKPPFDMASPVWRYNIKALSHDEKKLFVNFFLEDLFFELKQRPLDSGDTAITDIVVLDEAHIYMNDDPDSILNVIAKEARKFHLGLICASQSPTHFSEDFLSNVSTKILLKLDEMYWQGASRMLRVPADYFPKVTPTKVFLLQMNTRTATQSSFIPVQQLAYTG